MPTYKLYYFTARGVAEPTRMMLKLGGQEFEDIRYTHEEWPKHKTEMPFGQMPVLDVDGVKLAQSGAVGRFVANKLGYAGKTDIEKALVDGIIDQYKDHYSEIKSYFYTAMGILKGDAEELYKTVYIPARDKFYEILTKILKKNKSGFLVGNSVTWADLQIADHMFTIQKQKKDAFEKFPELLALKAKVEAIPAIKKWYSERPQTGF